MIVSLNDSRAAVQSGNPPSLSHALLRHRGADATEPLDHVYAILGFTSANDLPVEDRLRIDYNLDVGKVFKEAALHCMESEISLDVLAALGSSKESGINDLPSWVPNWGDFDHLYVPLEGSSYGPSRKYSCSRDSSPEMRLTGNDKVLISAAIQ